MSLLERTVLRAVPVPAANKWTTLHPCISQIALMLTFCGLVPRALNSMLPARGFVAEKVSDLSDDAQLGAPKDEAKHFRKLRSKRRNRCFQFLLSEGAACELLLWMTITSHVLRVHYHLFNTATWWSQRRDGGAGLFEFLDDARNPAARAVGRASALLFEDVLWDPLCSLVGAESGTWPAWVRQQARVLSLMAAGILWRHLVHDLRRFPFNLAPLADINRPVEQAQDTAQALLRAPPCCLDKGLSLRLRRVCPTMEALTHEDTRVFLNTLFERCVVTSTFVERVFAKLTRWCGVSQGLPALAAKHMLFTFEANHRALFDPRTLRGRIRQPQAHGVSKSSARSRPVWLQTRRQNFTLSGFSQFKRDEWATAEAADTMGKCRELEHRWGQMTAEEQKPFEQKAKELRALAVAQPCNLEDFLDEQLEAPAEVGQPWSIGASSSHSWPVAPHIVRDHIARPAGFAVSAKTWEGANADATQPDLDFPKTVAAEPVCHTGECMQSLCQEAQGVVREMHAALSLLVKHGDLKQHGCLPILEYTCGERQVWAAIVHHSLETTVEATLCLLELAANGPSKNPPGPPFILQLRRGEHGWPVLQTETAFFMELARTHPEWAVSCLVWDGTLGKLCEFSVSARVPIDLGGLQAKADEEKAVADALRLVKQLRKPGKTTARTTKRRKPSSRCRKLAEQPSNFVSDVNDSQGDSAGSVSDGSLDDAQGDSAGSVSDGSLSDVQGDSASVGPHLAAAPSVSSTSSEPDFVPQTAPTLAEAVAVLPRRHDLGPRAQRGDRLAVAFGPFQISRVWSQQLQVCIGFGARCGRHRNASGQHDRTQCQKQVLFGKERR